MKLRTDIVRLYKDVHSWVGILCGLFLFTAFFAGAVTMFEAPLERWLSPPSPVPATALTDAKRLIAETFKARPEARREFAIHLEADRAPARMSWLVPDPKAKRDHNHEGGTRFVSGFDAGGRLRIAPLQKSETAQFVDTLHQQAGVPLVHDIAMTVVGAICLLYALALVSGVIVLLPSLVKDLFALRLGKNLKRMWLDVHNVLGLFSIPFHIVMALTSLVFAFHDYFYDAQSAAIYGGKLETMWQRPPLSPHKGMPLLAPDKIVAQLQAQAPGFAPTRLEYRTVKGGALLLNVWGRDDRYGVRAPSDGMVGVDPYDGKILQRDYLPGAQNAWLSAVTGFFALHFGNYGGLPVRWGYVLLGLAGAFLFYTGNLLWVQSRRSKNGGVDTPASRILSRLTIGWTLGTVAGVLALFAAGKALSAWQPAAHGWQGPLFYATLVAAIAWAQWRGEVRARTELSWLCGAAMLGIAVAAVATPA